MTEYAGCCGCIIFDVSNVDEDKFNDNGLSELDDEVVSTRSSLGEC